MLSADACHQSILFLLDLAFDTSDHDILLDLLETLVGINGTALQWFRSYIKDKHFWIGITNLRSAATGSVLGPILFSIYMFPLGHLTYKHNISFHFYADDTQIYLSCNPVNNYQNTVNLQNCLHDIIHEWISQNFLQLNTDKTKILIIGQDSANTQISNSLGSLSYSVTQHCRNLKTSA